MRNCLSSTDLDRLIAEDLPYGDLTTHTLSVIAGFTSSRACIQLSARDPMCVCGTEEAKMIFERLDATATVLAPSAQAVSVGAPLLSAQGSIESLFAAWKLAQTLIEWSSGVATAVAQLVNVARSVNATAVIACTRKTVPYTRQLAVKAVRAGGGSMHRLNLSDSLLLFPEHLQFVSKDITARSVLVQLRSAEPERSIVGEVTTVEQALELAAQVDVLQLEKFSVADVQRVAEYVREQQHAPVLAAAGGINPGNAAAYVAAGAQVLVTSWAYQAAPRDVQVRFMAEA